MVMKHLLVFGTLLVTAVPQEVHAVAPSSCHDNASRRRLSPTARSALNTSTPNDNDNSTVISDSALDNVTDDNPCGCSQVDWQKSFFYLTTINALLDYVDSCETMDKVRDVMDPTELAMTIPVNVTRQLDERTLRITGAATHVSLHGLSRIRWHPLEASSPNGLTLEAHVLEGLQMQAHVTLTVREVEHDNDEGDSDRNNDHLPPSSPLAPSITVTSTVEFELGAPSIRTTAEIRMSKCDGTWRQYLVCLGKSIWSYIKSIGFFQLHREFLGRFEGIHVEEMAVAFTDLKMNWYALKTSTTGSLPFKIPTQTPSRFNRWSKHLLLATQFIPMAFGLSPSPAASPSLRAAASPKSMTSYLSNQHNLLERQDERMTIHPMEDHSPVVTSRSLPTNPTETTQDFTAHVTKFLQGPEIQGMLATYLREEAGAVIKQRVNMALDRAGVYMQGRCYK